MRTPEHAKGVPGLGMCCLRAKQTCSEQAGDKVGLRAWSAERRVVQDAARVEEADDFGEAVDGMGEVKLMAVGEKENDAEEIEEEEREDDVEGWEIGDHANLARRGGEGEEEPAAEDGKEDEEEGE